MRQVRRMRQAKLDRWRKVQGRAGVKRGEP